MAIAAKRTQKVIARRQDLIEGTIKSIATLGYSNSTVQTICEAVGMSRGLIGHYFKGKDDLLVEAFRHLCALADDDVRQAIRVIGDDPLQRLLAATSATFTRSATRRDNALVWLAYCGAAPWNGSMKELHNRLYRRYRTWIQRLMEQAAEERGIVIDAKRAALTYAQMVDGFWIGWLMDREAYSLEDANQIACDWLLDLFGERRPAKRKVATVQSASASSSKERVRSTQAGRKKRIGSKSGLVPAAQKAKPRQKTARA
jgi:TetR/AcrR family transcriptional repressor of bet genes